MKTFVSIVIVFAVTISAVLLYPVAYPNVKQQKVVQPIIPNTKPSIEVVFVLDTTGSMGGLIQAAKEKIWSIASTLAAGQPAPEIKMGLVAYRDRGDAYVTRVTDLSADLDSVYATLMDFQAAGGGDTPESVNQALDDAIHKISWGKSPNTYRVVFLVGDAPAHMDYQDDIKYAATIAEARRNGIVINAIQCGQQHDTRKQWQHIAQLSAGRYFQVEQSGGAVAITTPFDKKIASLSKKLEQTRLYYGDKAMRLKQAAKAQASEKISSLASAPSLARRARFNASASGKSNFLGENELVDAVASGRVELEAIAEEELPTSLQTIAPEERQIIIKKKAQQRAQLEKEIKQLSQQRKEFMHKKIKTEGGAKDSLDEKIFGAILEQTREMRLDYNSDALDY